MRLIPSRRLAYFVLCYDLFLIHAGRSYLTVMATGVKTRPPLATDGKSQDELRALVDTRAIIPIPFMLLSAVAVWNFVELPLRHDDVVCRLVFTIRCLAPVAGLCMYFILRCANYRYNTDPQKLCTDPARATMPYELEVNNRVLRSTLEMSFIHSILQLNLCTQLDGVVCSKVIALFTIWFICGRVAFSVGYHSKSDPLQRAYGFSINLSTMMIQLVLTFSMMLWYGPLSGISLGTGT